MLPRALFINKEKTSSLKNYTHGLHLQHLTIFIYHSTPELCYLIIITHLNFVHFAVAVHLPVAKSWILSLKLCSVANDALDRPPGEGTPDVQLLL